VTSLFGGGVTTQTALGAGKGILDSLFGPKISSVGDLIARFAGVRSESASSLLALAAPLVLHVLGKQRASIAPGAASLASLIGGQKTVLAGMMPPGLNSLLGWSGLTSETSAIGSSPAGAASRVTEEVARAARGVSRPSWVLPVMVFGALAVGALAWLSWPTTPTAPVPQAMRKLSELQLPDGVKISVPEGSFNFSVANWLASATDTSVPKRFLFEDLNFETGSTGPETGAAEFVRVRLAHHVERDSRHRSGERRGSAAGEPRNGHVEASPEEMYWAALPDKPSAKLFQHMVDPQQCGPEPVRIFGVV